MGDVLSIQSNPVFNNLEVVGTGVIPLSSIPTVTLNTGAGNWGVSGHGITVAHSLKFRPAIMAFLEFGQSSYPMPYILSFADSSGGIGGGSFSFEYRYSIGASSTSVGLELTLHGYNINTSMTGSSSLAVRYYLLRGISNH